MWLKRNGGWSSASGATFEGNPLPFTLTDNRYTVRFLILPFGPPNPVPGNDWFVENKQIMEAECTLLDNCAVLGTPGGPDKKKLDEHIADGTFTTGGDHQTHIRWQAEKYLFEKLEKDNSLIEPGTVYETFYNGRQNTAIDKLTGVKLSVGDLFKLDGATAAELSDLYNQRLAVLEALHLTDSLLLLAAEADIPALQAEKDALTLQLDSLSTVNRSLVNTIKDGRENQVQAIFDTNRQIVTSETYEENERLVNEIFLQTLAIGKEPEGTAITELEHIAVQCPYTGGPAVFRARSLLADRTELAFPDDMDCGAVTGERAVATDVGTVEKDSPVFSVFPNPTDNRFTVRVDKGAKVPRELRVMDVNGRLPLQQKMTEGQIEIDLQVGHLPRGIYLLQVYEEGKEVYSEKLILL